MFLVPFDTGSKTFDSGFNMFNDDFRISPSQLSSIGEVIYVTLMHRQLVYAVIIIHIIDECKGY